MPHTEKEKSRIEKQKSDNRNATDLSNSKEMLKQENKINVEFIKKITTEMKTTLEFFRNYEKS